MRTSEETGGLWLPVSILFQMNNLFIMRYYYSTFLKNCTFSEALNKTKLALKEEGFGILTEIDLKATFKEKLNVDFPNYKILGACNPSFAYKALQAENKIGTMLPCNVILRQDNDKTVEVAAVDPIASMMGVQNEDLAHIATEVREKLKKAISNV